MAGLNTFWEAGLKLTQHPLRLELHHEVHSRPSDGLSPPAAVLRYSICLEPHQKEDSRSHLLTLLKAFDIPDPDLSQHHFKVNLGEIDLRWEMHTEFVTYTFFHGNYQAQLGQDFVTAVLERQAPEWLSKMPGQVLSAVHIWVQEASVKQQHLTQAVLDTQLFHSDALMGSSVAEGFAHVYSDFLIDKNGYSHFYVTTFGISKRRLGRTLQRLLEIETYRMAASLALPAARQAMSLLNDYENELADLAKAITVAKKEDEMQLLDRLTLLAAKIESLYAQTHSRLSASAAYFDLLDRRILDVREQRLAGLQTLREFMDRRLNPARGTCAGALKRQEALSARVSRVSDMLRTRVQIEQQQSNQAIWSSMEKRQNLQLQLQATVEGLSVAAISYYIVGLVSYLAKGAGKLGWPFSADATAATVLPVIVMIVWWSLRQLHQKLHRNE